MAAAGSNSSFAHVSPSPGNTATGFTRRRKFAYRSRSAPAVVYGGANVGDQMRELERGCSPACGHPGRLVDLERGQDLPLSLPLTSASTRPTGCWTWARAQIRRIVEQDKHARTRDPPDHDVLATLPKEIQMLARDFLKDYVFLAAGRVGSTSENNHSTEGGLGGGVRQEVSYSTLWTPLAWGQGPRRRGLPHAGQVRRDEAQRGLAGRVPRHRGFPVTSIHGDRTQREREEALRRSQCGQTPHHRGHGRGGPGAGHP